MMKKQRRLIGVLMIFVLAFSLMACGSQPKNEESSMEVKNEEPSSDDTAKPSEEAEKSDQKSGLEEKIMAYFANMPKHIYKIDQDDFLEKVKAEEEMTILDIRSAKDYEKEHIKGAVNAPWGGTAIADILPKIPKDKPLYIYCYSGQTAGQTIHILNLAGFDARSVNLGFNFGISKVEGYNEMMTQEKSVLEADVTEIDSDLQNAATAYYKGLADVKETPFKNYIVSEDGLKKMMDEKEDFYLLSIRSKKDFDSEHIEGAQNLPWGAGMEKGFSELPKDKPIVVYCYSGQTAGQTVAALRLLGYDAVSLKGGIGVGANAPLGWKNKGFDVVQ